MSISTADVPFPAESMSECRRCGAKIGFVKVPISGKVYPVEPKGYSGIEVPNNKSWSHVRGKAGWRLTGHGIEAAWTFVREPESHAEPGQRVAVFQEHLPLCPRQRKRRYIDPPDPGLRAVDRGML